MLQIPDLAREQIVRTMIDLTRPSSLHRIVVAGSDCADLDLDLRRRGFFRVTTMGRCIPRAQHTVGLIAGRHSLQALELMLAQITHFLSTTATIAVVINSRENGISMKVREKLERLGFRIEAGVRCRDSFVLSARRQNFSHMAKAA